MNTKSRAIAAELAWTSRSLERKMLELGYLRQLVADKEALKAKVEPADQRKTVSSQELPEQTREFLKSFQADRGALRFWNFHAKKRLMQGQI